MYLGIVAVVVTLSKVHAGYVAENTYDYTNSFRFAWSIAYIVLLGISAYGAGLPDVPRSLRGALGSSLAAAGGAAVGISLIQLVVGDALLPRFVVFGSALLLVPWYMVCVALATGGRVRAEDRDRVFVVGSAEEAALLEADLERRPEQPANLVGSVTVEDVSPAGGARPALSALAIERSASVVVLDRTAQADPAVVDQVAALHEAGVRVRTLSLFYEEWLGKLPLGELERVSLMFDIGEVHRARYGRAARLFDLVCALVGLLVLGLALPFVIVGDLLANRGPLFFSQPRVGKNGHPFDMLKFRSMRPSVGSEGEWTGENDPRITPFGRVLRVTHVDELPQVINIFRGDLSVVGPRPEQPHYVEELSDKLPFYGLRHLVRPGLTGWAQVKYHYGADASDALEKLQYEFYYLRHQGVALDARIVGRTIRSVLARGGR
jgi:lipopolysaccharide/colanic/teichoic acid biosynthesis glycosyltransferase